jgi:Ca-activated chloride channel family protein
MRLATVAVSLMLFVSSVFAATPGSPPDAPLATFRVETGEVHIAFSAFDHHRRPVTPVSTSDFTLLRDGAPVEQAIEVERRNESPITAAVMTDVSESMQKAVPLARGSWQWMGENLLRPDDDVTYFDFGSQLLPANSPQRSATGLTSFNDCLLKLIPQISTDSAGKRVLILFTDGRDSASIHPLQDAINRALERDVVIYAITTWKYKIKYDEQVLDTLTRSTGGRYFVVKDQKEMVGALRDIVQELRNGYELVFRAEKGRGGLHHITIQPTNRKIGFYHRAAYYQPTNAEPSLVAAGR